MAALEKYNWTRLLRIKHQCMRECLAEFMGMAMLEIFSCGVGMSYTLSGGNDISYLSINIINGIAVMLAMYMCGGVTGGCFNPAISFAMVLTDRLHWSHLPFQFLGQLCGSFTSAAITYGVYMEALDNYDGGNRSVRGPKGTAGIFCSFPQDYLSTTGGLIDQIVGGGLLIISGLCIIDRYNLNPHAGLAPIPIGLSVTAIGGAFGWNCGYPINPAKDLGPRIFISIAGWGHEAFSFRDYNWFWVPIVGPFIGSTLACFIYWVFIELHWPEKVEVPDMEFEIQTPLGMSTRSMSFNNLNKLGWRDSIYKGLEYTYSDPVLHKDGDKSDVTSVYKEKLSDSQEKPNDLARRKEQFRSSRSVSLSSIQKDKLPDLEEAPDEPIFFKDIFRGSRSVSVNSMHMEKLPEVQESPKETEDTLNHRKVGNGDLSVISSTHL